MKANELMIGDWVKDKYKSKPHKVDSWADFNNAEDLSPIPITEEILEKNGWKSRQGYPTEYEYIEGEYAHCYYDVKHKHCIIEIWDEPTIDILIDSVHELQHALRLCGLNGLADNFKI